MVELSWCGGAGVRFGRYVVVEQLGTHVFCQRHVFLFYIIDD